MNPLVVLAQSPAGQGAVAQSLRLTSEAALQSDCRLVRLPEPLQALEAAPALAHLPKEQGRACYSGYLPHWGAFVALDYALRQKGLQLLNTPRQTRRAMELDRWYPLVADLTARSVVLSSEEDISSALELGTPLFVKGLIKSRKEQGYEACLARDEGALRALVAEAAGGRVVARELMPLRLTGEERMGFPVAREYRVYLYQGRELGHGYYWGGADPFGLARSERAEMIALATEAAARVDVPLLAVDVGQLESGQWRLVEIGDPQFSGVAHMTRTTFWTRLRELVET